MREEYGTMESIKTEGDLGIFVLHPSSKASAYFDYICMAQQDVHRFDMDTTTEYNNVINYCKELFLHKTRDYGTSWRIMRLTSVTDQLFIKALRIRTLEVKKVSKVGEGIIDEYIGIVNYSIIAMMQLELADDHPNNLAPEYVEALYDEYVNSTRDLMFAKNHDYGEAWRDMRVSSLTDMILTKIHRVKQIEDNDGQTIVSEGLKANYQDMLNYAVFALIRLGVAETKNKTV